MRSPTLVAACCLNHILACLHEFFGILRGTVDQDLVMEMRTSAAASAAEFSNLMMGGDFLTVGDNDAVKVGIACNDAMTMVDVDYLPVSFLDAGKYHSARRGAVDRRAIGCGKIDASVEGLFFHEWVWPSAKAALDLVVCERRRKRQRLQNLL